MMTPNRWQLLFWADLLLELLALAAGLPALQQVAKPLLLPLLIAGLLAAGGGRGPLAGALLLALGLSWLGDVFLMMEDRDPKFFLAGLAAFLLAHGTYTYYFMRLRIRNRVAGPWRPVPAALALLYTLGLVLWLLPGLGALKGPVILYSLAITGMLLSALNAFGPGQRAAGGWAAAGALLFVASDSCLAINRFRAPFAGAGLVIMLTYALDQWSLVRAAVRSALTRQEPSN